MSLVPLLIACPDGDFKPPFVQKAATQSTYSSRLLIQTHTLRNIMRVRALPHPCMDAHTQSDCIRKHPSCTWTVVICQDVLFLFCVLSPFSFCIDLCVQVSSIKQSRVEQHKSWAIYSADCWCQGNIRKIWYPYAQYLTNERYLWTGRRHGWGVIRDRVSQRRDSKGRELKAMDVWLRQRDNKWELKGGVTQKEKRDRVIKGRKVW